MFIEFVLLIALSISLITDLRKRKILNIVTFPAILTGFLYYTLISGFDGFLYSVQGCLVGLGVLFIPYLFGGMGAGDVKLMAAIGALMGVSFVLYSFVYTSIAGGILSIILIVKKKGFNHSVRSCFFYLIFFKDFLTSLKNPEKHSSIIFPYGVAITIGTLGAYIWGGFL